MASVSACTTMAEYDCKNTVDWYKVGQRHAKQGMNSELKSLQKTCPDRLTQENSDFYSKGYSEELVRYCTAENFYHLASHNVATFFASCSKSLHSPLRDADSQGKAVYALKSDISILEGKLKGESSRSPVEEPEELERHLEEKRNLLDEKLAEAQSKKYF